MPIFHHFVALTAVVLHRLLRHMLAVEIGFVHDAVRLLRAFLFDNTAAVLRFILIPFIILILLLLLFSSLN